MKGGRVVDPANGRDGEFDVLIEDGRVARIGKSLPADGAEVLAREARLDRGAGPDRHPRAPARAGAGAQGNDRDRRRVGRRRRIHRRRLHAEHRSGERSPRRHRADSPQGRRRQPRARLSDRRGLDGVARRADVGARRAEGGRLRGVHRRRAAGGERAADAAGARIRRDARRADRRSLRGSVAQGGRRRARGLLCRAARAARHSRRRRIDHGRAGHRAGRADRRALPRLPHERAAVDPRGPRREGARHDQRHLRGRAAPFRDDRRGARDADPLRHQREDEPAAAGGGGSRRHARGDRRRHRRRDCHRPRAAPRRREAGRVRSRPLRHRRARDLRAARVRPARARRARSASSRAIELLSTNPARVFRLPGGSLADGAIADITILAPGRARHHSRRGAQIEIEEHAVRWLAAQGGRRRRRSSAAGSSIRNEVVS